MSRLRRVTPGGIGECAAQFNERTYFHSPGWEFGHELQLFVPFVFGLHKAGLRVVAVSRFPSIYFNFLPSMHPDKLDVGPGEAHYRLDVSNPDLSSTRHNRKQRSPRHWRVWHPNDVNKAIAGNLKFWCPPPYKTLFRNRQFKYHKPTLVIQNKYATEPGKHKSASGKSVEQPYGFIPLELLDRLFTTLGDRYQIIYNRFTDTIDNSVVQDLGDFDLIAERYPEVLTIQGLARQYGLDYDQTQLMVYANTEKFVGVQGGGALLMHYFAGKAIIFHRLPPDTYDKIISGAINFAGQMELQCGRNFYASLFPALSGQLIEPCYDLDSFERRVLGEF